MTETLNMAKCIVCGKEWLQHTKEQKIWCKARM